MPNAFLHTSGTVFRAVEYVAAGRYATKAYATCHAELWVKLESGKSVSVNSC